MQSEELSPEELSALLTSYMPEVPGYRVIRRIGKGGMSYVYLGVQESLDRQVAIKVMSPEALKDEKSKQRFEQEAHTIAKLEHPCIVGIHEVGRTPQGLLYYVLPYLARGHLGQRDFTADEPRIIEVLRALLSALDYAHARGIVHRDVKAENVLFDNADRPLLTDFGIALSRREDSSRITTAGLAVGSGGYMSPEQARGEAVDGRADLYSVGVLAFELLTGRLPFQSADPLALALMHAQDPIPRLPVEHKHWQSLLDRSMAKSPDNRFRNAQQMLGALNQISLKERAAATDETSGAGGASSRRWIRPAAIGAAALGLLLLAAMWLRPASVEPVPAGSVATADADGADGDIASSLPPPSSASAIAQPATTAPAITQPTPEGAVAPSAVSATPADFAAVLSGVTVNQLDFDPLQPGERELHMARRQIRQNRLSVPAGDNASDSLLAAMRAGAAKSTTTLLADEILGGARNSLIQAVKAGHDDAAKNEYRRTLNFAGDSGRLQGGAWKDLRLALVPVLLARMEKAQVAADARTFDQTKALARALAVEPSALEPAWSKPIIASPPAPAKIMRSVGPTVVLVQPPSRNRAGLAFMRGEITHAEYAEFANSTGRSISRCRNRLAPITFKKRTWVDPGFPQTGAHPAVCVSFEDASAYAQWLSRRTGETFRLPSASEWRQIAAYRGSGNACQDGRIDCGLSGTAAVSQGPSSPFGLTGVRGNAREWLSDCQAGCRQRLVSGLGWRDGPSRAEPMRSSGFDAATGFDDVGFRLVREVPAR